MYTNSSNNEYEYEYDDGESSSSSFLAFQRFVARVLGYCVGFGSLMLYTPIIIRLCRQKHADGLVMSTWWLKMCSYLLSDVYYVRNRYELSTYAEMIVISIETSVVLVLVAVYQQKTKTTSFWVCISLLLAGAAYGFTIAPDALVATGQVWTVFIYTTAIFPQFWHNFSTKTKGDYSPITAGLTVAGCLVRIFTTVTLNGSDPILLFSFVSSTLINAALLSQIVYYGVLVEGLTITQVLLSDIVTTNNHNHPGVAAEEVSDAGAGGAYGGLFDGDDKSDGGEKDALSVLQQQEPTKEQRYHQRDLLHHQDSSDQESFRRRRSNMEMPEVQSPTTSITENVGGSSSTNSSIASTTVYPESSSHSGGLV